MCLRTDPCYLNLLVVSFVSIHPPPYMYGRVQTQLASTIIIRKAFLPDKIIANMTTRSRMFIAIFYLPRNCQIEIARVCDLARCGRHRRTSRNLIARREIFRVWYSRGSTFRKFALISANAIRFDAESIMFDNQLYNIYLPANEMREI